MDSQRQCRERERQREEEKRDRDGAKTERQTARRATGREEVSGIHQLSKKIRVHRM